MRPSVPVVLLLLHDFPDPGRSHRFPCSSPSDTLNPHSLLFAGMQDRHPGPARGRGRALWLLSLPPSRDVVLVVSAALAYGDRRDTAAAGAKGPLVRVIGKSDACGPQLVDQSPRLTGSHDPHGAVRRRLILA